MPRKRKEHPDRWNDPFPRRLRQLLEEHDLSHQVFGDYLGVARQSVGNYCDGSVSPSTDTLMKVADYFSVSVDYLLGRTEIRTPEPDVQMASSLTGLSEEAITVLHDYCGKNSQKGIRKTLNDLLTHPDFDIVADYWELAWHCAQESQRWNGPDLSDDSDAAGEMAELTQAMTLVRDHGMAIRGWDECATDNMTRAGDFLKMILTQLASSWCNPGMDKLGDVTELDSLARGQGMLDGE